MRDRSPIRRRPARGLRGGARDAVRVLDVDAAGGKCRIEVPVGAERSLGDGLDPLARVGVEELRRVRPLGLPHWAQLWPASVAVAREILRRSARASGWPYASVADVGCGVGLVGVAAARAGSRAVFADRDADARAFAQRNAARAGARGARALDLDWNRPSAAVVEELAACSLTVCADVAYEFRHTTPLFALLTRLVEGAGREVWLADPFRPTAEDLIRRLRGVLDVSEERLTTSWEGRRHEIRLLVLRPRTAASGAPA